MGIKKFFGIVDCTAELKMSEEFKAELRQCIAEEVYTALTEYYDDNPDHKKLYGLPNIS